MSLLNKLLYPVELVSEKHEKFINKKKGEIMFPGRIFYKILLRDNVNVYLLLLKPNDYSKANCYIHPKAKYGYAISNGILITLFCTKDKYIDGIIKSAILNGAETFKGNDSVLSSTSINNDYEMIYDKLIRRGLKPRYE